MQRFPTRSASALSMRANVAPADRSPSGRSSGFSTWQLGIIIPICVVVLVAVAIGFIYQSWKRRLLPKPQPSEQKKSSSQHMPEPPPIPLTRQNVQRHQTDSTGWRALPSVRQTDLGQLPSKQNGDRGASPGRAHSSPPAAVRQKPKQEASPLEHSKERQVRQHSETLLCTPRLNRQLSPTRNIRGNGASGAAQQQVYIDLRKAQNMSVHISSNHPHPEACKRFPKHSRIDSGYEFTDSPRKKQRSPDQLPNETRPELPGEPDFITPLDFAKYRR
ncbi:MAG: hypothetical protein Q9191_001903 [Dirinaria sp. TL-2023a]